MILQIQLFKCRQDNIQSNLIQVYETLLGTRGLTTFCPQ